MKKICCVIVVYNPIIKELDMLIKSLKSQVNRIFIINNGNKINFIESDFISLYEMGENTGIAYAQNFGIKKALDMEFDYILLSDQDSVFPKNYVRRMLESAENNNDFSVFCPIFIDEITNSIPNVMVSKFKGIIPPNVPCQLAMAISSGMFIDINIFKNKFFFNEKLFIDYVDNEWCWRITSFGYKILLIPDLRIIHHLGNKTKKLFFKRKVLHSSIRYYYIIRNGFFLAFYSPFLNIFERIKLIVITLKLIISLTLLYKNFHLLILGFFGFFHGLLKKMGKANPYIEKKVCKKI